MLRRHLLPGLLLLAASSVALAAPTFYIRNRAVEGRVSGLEVYVSRQSLPRYLTAQELSRVAVEAGQITCDGLPVAALGPGEEVPLVALARALGFQVKSSAEMGTVDLIPPGALTPKESASAPGLSSRRPEYQIAAARMQKVLSLYRAYNDPRAQARVEAIGRRVAAVTPLAGIEWNFILLDDLEANALCVGEGHVFLTRGTLNLGLSDDELAGVLGHEIAHGIRRHCFRIVDLLEEAEALLAEAATLRAEIERYQQGQGVPPQLTVLRNRLEDFEKKRLSLLRRLEQERVYAQLDEEEADVLGMRYAVAAGYAADGLARALQRLEAHNVEQFGSAVLDDDMTHPPLRRRLEILRRVQASWK
jgi:predicted Zn-dependent protease